MKNKITHIFSVLMVCIMAVSLTACGEEITLESRTVNGITLNVPSDFKAFEEKEGMQVATDEDSNATIIISPKADAEGVKASDYDQDSYQQANLTTYTDISFEKFDNKADIGGNSTLYAKFKGTTQNKVKVVVYNYVIFFEDGNCQSLFLSYADNGDTSLRTNIDNVTKSIKAA